MERFTGILSEEFSGSFCGLFQGDADREELEATADDDMNINYFPRETKEISFKEFVMRQPMLYGDYRNAMGNSKEPRVYEDLLDYEAIYFLFQEILDEYNGGVRCKALNLVLFEYCLEHLTRIHRVLRMQNGHILVVGPPGVGKKSLCELAAFAANREIREFNLIGTEYSLKDFEHDLKEVLMEAGLRQSKVAILLNLDQVILKGVKTLFMTIFIEITF